MNKKVLSFNYSTKSKSRLELSKSKKLHEFAHFLNRNSNKTRTQTNQQMNDRKEHETVAKRRNDHNQMKDILALGDEWNICVENGENLLKITVKHSTSSKWQREYETKAKFSFAPVDDFDCIICATGERERDFRRTFGKVFAPYLYRRPANNIKLR